MAKTVDEKKQRRIEEVQALLDAFADQYLTDAPDIASYIDKLWAQLGRKRTYPITGGTKEVWAAAVVTVIARLNFLFDRSQPNSVTLQEICEFFGVSTSRALGRASEIEKACKIRMGHEGLCSGRLSVSFTLEQLIGRLTAAKSMEKEMGIIKGS